MPKVVAEYKAQARSRIVDAALTVFRRKGFRSATMDDIASEIGVSKGALYLYFHTKIELLSEIQRRSRSEVLEAWEGLIDEGDIAEGIAHSLDGVFSGKFDAGVWHEIAGESAKDPEVRAALTADHRDDVRLMRRFLQRLEDRGRIPKMEAPQILAEIIMSLLQATAVWVMLQEPMPEARRRLIREIRLVLHL
ncbi:MAG: TetR/AcrR family transcriptional regulator [Thermoplasmata archaeon]